MEPSKAELYNLWTSPAMKWAIEKLNNQFKPLPPYISANDWDDYQRRVAQQQVINSLKKIFHADFTD